MRLSFAGGAIVAAVLVALVIAYSTLFTVHQTRQAIVVRLGQPVDVVTDPGLNYKYPLIETVIYIDKRILDVDSRAQEVIASDQKRLGVDAFARYKITKPLLFYQAGGRFGRGRQCPAPPLAEFGAAARARRGHADAGRARPARRADGESA